jgi:4-hydroxybenzoate polyprenyltransferase
VWAFTLALAAGFVAASFALNRLCGVLSPVALAIVFGYSYTKRFTWASHLVLGLSLAIAPVGGWLAIAGRFDLLPWLLAAAVVLWVAGFDTIYACQDEAFDRSHGLHSIPARFGIPRALVIARSFHVLALFAMVAVGIVAHLHPVYWLGLAVVAGVLVWEHRLVSASDLSKLGVAFLNANGVVSVLYFVTILVALAL